MLAAAAAAVTVGLSWLPLRAPVPDAAMADVSAFRRPAPSLVVHHPALYPSSHSSVPAPVAVVGVAKAPIHDFQFVQSASDIVTEDELAAREMVEDSSALDAAAEEARREFVLAARLITAVLLGVMVGVERRATALNMGVRSITIITLSAALLSVVTTCSQATGVTLWPAIAAAPTMPVLGAGVAAGVGLYLSAMARPRRPREMVPMCLVVGLAVAMGGSCGAGLSLVTAGCYLGAISVMRATESSGAGERSLDVDIDMMAPGEDSDFRMDADEFWDDEDEIVRVAERRRSVRRVQVAEMRGSVSQDARRDPRLDPEQSDFAL